MPLRWPKKLCLVYHVTPSWLKFVKKYKSLAVEGMIVFFGWMPNINIIELAPGDQVLKKLKMDHLWGYTSYFMPQLLQNVIKKQKGHASKWNSEYMSSIVK